jgi:tetratricopeptide (TPR) repeat protein
MPKRDVRQVEHSALTNHRIPARQGEPVQAVSYPEVGGVVVVDAPAEKTPQLSKVTLLQAYGELSARYPGYGERYAAVLNELGREEPQSAIVQEALGHQLFVAGQFEEAISHLGAALSLRQPAIYLELAQSEAKLGREGEAIQYLKTGVALTPYDPVMRKTLILQYINARAYAEARQQLEEYVSLFPEDAFMRSMLEKVSR